MMQTLASTVKRICKPIRTRETELNKIMDKNGRKKKSRK